MGRKRKGRDGSGREGKAGQLFWKPGLEMVRVRERMGRAGCEVLILGHWWVLGQRHACTGECGEFMHRRCA